MKKKLLIGLASVIGIFILIGIIAIATAPEEQPTQIQPPAETTEPVSPPTTPEKPAITIAEQAYVNAVVDQAMEIGKVFTNLGPLLQDFKYGNDEWTLQVAAQLVTVRMLYDEAMELDPPSSMAEIHLKYTQGMKAYNDMTYLLTQGIDDLDATLVEEAGTKMETGTRFINEATQLVLEFKETHK